MGMLSGFMGGVFNLSGITLMIYYINVIDDKLEYASSMQATMVIVSVFSIALNVAFGNYSHIRVDDVFSSCGCRGSDGRIYRFKSASKNQ